MKRILAAISSLICGIALGSFVTLTGFANPVQIGFWKVAASSGISADYWQWFGGTSGTSSTFSITTLANGDHTSGAWTYSITDTSSLLSFNTSGQKNTVSKVNGVSDTGTYGLAWAGKATGAASYFQGNPSSTYGTTTFGFWFYFPGQTVQLTDINLVWFYNLIRIGCTVSAVDVPQIYWDFPGSDSSPVIIPTSAAWYWVTGKLIPGATSTLQVYNASGSLVGTDTITSNAGTWSNLLVGDSNGSSWSLGLTAYFDNIVIETTAPGSLPLGP